MPHDRSIPSGDVMLSEIDFRAIFDQSTLGKTQLRIAHARWLVDPSLCQLLCRLRERVPTTLRSTITHPDEVHFDLVQYRGLAAAEIDSYAIEKRRAKCEGAHCPAACFRDVVWDLMLSLDVPISARMNLKTAALGRPFCILEAEKYSLARDRCGECRHARGVVS
jgi:hypothetical protein